MAGEGEENPHQESQQLGSTALAGISAAELVQADEAEAARQAAEQQAVALKHTLDRAKTAGRQRAKYWETLEPVLVIKGGKLQCMVKCICGGPGVCGKELSSKNVAKSAKDHYTFQGCKGVRITQGQAMLGTQQAEKRPATAVQWQAFECSCHHMCHRAQLVALW